MPDRTRVVWVSMVSVKQYYIVSMFYQSDLDFNGLSNENIWHNTGRPYCMWGERQLCREIWSPTLNLTSASGTLYEVKQNKIHVFPILLGKRIDLRYDHSNGLWRIHICIFYQKNKQVFSLNLIYIMLLLLNRRKIFSKCKLPIFVQIKLKGSNFTPYYLP